MSDFTNTNDNPAIRRKLLMGASVLVMAACVMSQEVAKAEDAERPMIWLELGEQFAQLENSQEPYLPPFVEGTRLPFITQSPDGTEKNARHSWDSDAQISFQPKGSDWIFSARIQYGRDTKNKASEQRTPYPSSPYVFARYMAYQGVSVQNAENHTIVDFNAGKDVGLGMFGHGGSSVASFGVRYAHLDSKSSIDIRYQPTNSVFKYHKFYGSFDAKRDFTGLGPSISWDGSANLAGDPSDSWISLDWGVNGAVLFGRQRTKIRHQTSNLAITPYPIPNKSVIYQTSHPPSRSRQVVVPNLGGFAGLSWRYPSAKVSIGYRADFFFNAIDGGIDAAKKENRGFYGPFASISVGLGD